MTGGRITARQVGDRVAVIFDNGANVLVAEVEVEQVLILVEQLQLSVLKACDPNRTLPFRVG